jgi:hypothetical protein
MRIFDVQIRLNQRRPFPRFRFAYQPAVNDLLLALVMAEDSKQVPDPVKRLMRDVRYALPVDLEIRAGLVTHGEINIRTTEVFVFEKVDTEPQSRVQNLSRKRQSKGSKRVPTVFYRDGFREQMVPPQRACDTSPGGMSAGDSRDNSVRDAVEQSDPFAERW